MPRANTITADRTPDLPRIVPLAPPVTPPTALPKTLTDALESYRQAHQSVAEARERAGRANVEAENARLALAEAEEMARKVERTLLALAKAQ